MLIDCEACAARGPACGDCVVTVLLGAPAARRSPTGADDGPGPAADVLPGIDLDDRERAAIAVLARCGLIPPLRLVTTDSVRIETWSEPEQESEQELGQQGGAARFDDPFDGPYDDPNTEIYDVLSDQPFDDRYEGRGRQAAG